MTRLTPPNLQTIRTRPQQTKIYMSIFQPQVVMKCRINDSSITKGARVITYNSVSFGAYTSIEANFSMWVGSADGLQDLGKVRVRSATSTQITVSENSNIQWQNAAYLTIYKYVELWPIFPRIIQDPANVENTIWYKDYDIAYTNQNTILGTYICMGPNRAAYLDPASSQAQLYYTATGTLNLVGTSLNYNWTFEGGTPSSSSQETPGLVSYTNAGNYVTRLQISGSNGSVDTSYRYIRIHDPAHPAIQKWQLTDLTGSRDEGGYTASFKVFETIPIQENAVIVLFMDNFYGATHQSLGGNYPNGSSIFWTGFINKDSIQYDYLHSEMTFDASSITGMMKNQQSFAISVGSSAAPAYWYELLDMDGRRGMYHYLRWHTTAMQMADFQFLGSDQKTQFFDSDRESMYDAVDNFMRSALMGKSVSDRQGKVWLEIDAEAYSNPTGSFPSVMDITKQDWMNTPSIDERLSNEMSFIEMGGVAYSGSTTGTFSAILAGAPGTTPGFRGTIETHEGLILASQSQLNQMAGNVFANRNSPYANISIEMAGNYLNLDIAPQESVRLSIPASDTVRNLAIDGLFLPNNVSWKFFPQDSILLPQIDFKQLINGVIGDAETVTIPTPTDVGGGFSVPGLQIPPIPSLTVPDGSAQTSVLDQYRVIKADRTLPAGPTTYVTEANRGSIVLLTTPDLSLASGMIQYQITQPGLYICTATLQYSASSSPLATLTTSTGLVRVSSKFQQVAGTWSASNNVVALFYSTIPFTLSLNNATPGNDVSQATLEAARIAL